MKDQVWVFDRMSVRNTQDGPLRTQLEETIAMHGGVSGLLKKSWSLNKAKNNCASFYVARYRARVGNKPSKVMQAHLDNPGTFTLSVLISRLRGWVTGNLALKTW